MRDQSATPAAGRLAAAWMRAAAGRPRSVLALLAVLAGLSLWAAAGLRVDTDSSRMLSPDLPFQQRAHALNEAFPALKNALVIAIRAETPDAADAAARALVGGLEGRPGVSEVFAPSVDPFFARNGLLYLSEAAIEDRLTRLSKSANMLAALRAEPSLPGFLAATDAALALAAREGAGLEGLAPFLAEAARVIEAAGSDAPRAFAWQGALDPDRAGPVLRTITVTPALDFAALSPAREAIAAARAAIAALPGNLAGPVEIGLTGEPVLRAEELRSVAATMPVSLALSMALVALALWLALGTAGRTGLALGALVLTLVLTTGAAAVTVGALNLVSVAFVVLMTGLGIDFAIHTLAHLEEDAARMPTDEALPETGRALGPALALGAASTAAAFLAFAATDFVGMAQLGVIGASGVVIAYAVTLTLVPAAVALRPGLARGRRRAAFRVPVAERGRAAPLTALALGLAAAAIGSGARFDADPMGLRDPAAPSVVTYGWLAEDAALAPMRLSVIAGDAAGAEAVAARLAARPEVEAARWIDDFVPAAQDAKLALVDLAWPSLDFAVNGEAVALGPERATTPTALAARLRAADTAETRRLAAALEAHDRRHDAVLEAALFRHFPALIDRLGAQLGIDGVTRADLPGPLAARYVAADGRLRVEAVPAADITDAAARRAFVDAAAAAAPEAAGPPAQIAGAARAIAAAMLEATLVALAAAGLLAFAATRRALVVGAILLPVALAGAVTAAASVLLGMPFNYANVIVLPLMIGIGVDSGIHLALRRMRGPGLGETSTPGAVAASALTTIGAFATLALSSHAGTASMGVLLAVALSAAVVMAFALTGPLTALALAGRRA